MPTNHIPCPPARGLRAAALAAAACATFALAQPARANDALAAAIAAGAVGVAVGSALANKSSHHHDRPASASFSPKPGVICYTRQRACYKENGNFAANMTATYF